MKALSIIGTVLSAIGILLSIGMTEIHCYCSERNYYSHPGKDFGLVSLVINLFFLAFSIVAIVVSFRKKKQIP
jgi:hypothetical protein